MSTDVWYFVDRQGKQCGPVSRQQMKAAMAQGKLRAQDLVWRPGMAQWQPLASIATEFADAIHAEPAPPPVQAPAPVVARQPAVVYAGFARRFAAIMLDRLILYVATAFVVFIAALVPSDGDPGAPARHMLIAYGVIVALWLLYAPFQESSIHQATVGKRALGIKVTNAQGERLSFAHAFGRRVAALLSNITFYVGYVMAAFTARKQALHDLVADTLVVDRWAYTQQPERQKTSSSAPLILLVVLAGSVFPIAVVAAIAIPAYQDYVARSHVSRAITAAEPIKPLIARTFAAEHRCPASGEDGLPSADAYGTPPVGSIRAGSFDHKAGRCALEITLHTPGMALLEGKQIWLEMPSPKDVTQAWTCTSNLPDRYLPVLCRKPGAR